MDPSLRKLKYMKNALKLYYLQRLRVLGPAITKGFLKFLFICLLKTWKILAGLVGITNEKLALL